MPPPPRYRRGRWCQREAWTVTILSTKRWGTSSMTRQEISHQSCMTLSAPPSSAVRHSDLKLLMPAMRVSRRSYSLIRCRYWSTQVRKTCHSSSPRSSPNSSQVHLAQLKSARETQHTKTTASGIAQEGPQRRGMQSSRAISRSVSTPIAC